MIREENIKTPVKLTPIGKDYLWGGERLKTEYGKTLDLSPLAESWECSTHPEGLSTIEGGRYHDRTLKEVLKMFPDWVGTHPKEKDRLPVLIKFIDAKEDLSIQVHPDDDYAWSHEGEPGKIECWYILEAEPQAHLIYGFKKKVSPDIVEIAVKNGKIMDYLQKVPVHKGDVFFIRPGTVHAIGGGVILAEIQESSNITYRLYDYNRLDKNNQKRKLHVKQALEVLDYSESPMPRPKQRVLKYEPGFAREFICRCHYFQVERIILSGQIQLKSEKTSFQVLICINGEGEIIINNHTHMRIKKGNTFFTPADCKAFVLSGGMEILQVIG